MSDIRVECFYSDVPENLQEKVNKWLAESNNDIMDIKYSSTRIIGEQGIYDEYTAMIIYKIINQ